MALHILNEHKYLAYLRDENEETALHVLAQKKPVSYQMSMWKRLTMGCKFAKRKNDLPYILQYRMVLGGNKGL